MNINILYPGHQCHNWLPVQWVSYQSLLLRNLMQYFSKHELHAVCKMSKSRSVRLMCISHQKQREMHINHHAIGHAGCLWHACCVFKSIATDLHLVLWKKFSFCHNKACGRSTLHGEMCSSFRFWRFCTETNRTVDHHPKGGTPCKQIY